MVDLHLLVSGYLNGENLLLSWVLSSIDTIMYLEGYGTVSYRGTDR